MAFTTTRYLLPIILPQMAFELKSTISEMGLLASAYFATYTFSTIFWGRLSDKIGAVRIISLCCVLCMTSFIFTGLSPSLSHALSSYAIAGVGAGGLYVPLNALLTRWFRRRGTVIGITTTGATLAGLFLGVTVPFLELLYGWRIVWIILGLLYLVLAVASARFLKESPTTCDKARASEHAYRGGLDEVTIALWLDLASRSHLPAMGVWGPCLLDLYGGLFELVRPFNCRVGLHLLDL